MERYSDTSWSETMRVHSRPKSSEGRAFAVHKSLGVFGKMSDLHKTKETWGLEKVCDLCVYKLVETFHLCRYFR